MDRKLDWRRDGYLKRIGSLWDEHQEPGGWATIAIGGKERMWRVEE